MFPKQKHMQQCHTLLSRFLFIYTFSYSCMEEKVLFWGQIFEMEILMDLHVLK